MSAELGDDVTIKDVAHEATLQFWDMIFRMKTQGSGFFEKFVQGRKEIRREAVKDTGLLYLFQQVGRASKNKDRTVNQTVEGIFK